MYPYLSVEDLLTRIPEPNFSACNNLRNYFKEKCSNAKGSSHNHQVWEGGYFDHISDIMNYACFLYEKMGELRPLPFSLPDALLVLFLHDIEKPVKYTPELADQYSHMTNDEIRSMFINTYNFQLNEDHKNGLKYIHGEGSDYSGQKRVASPLATFCHCCDVISARIYFDQPRNKNR